MRDAETRFQPAGEGVGWEKRWGIQRRLGYANAVPLGRDGRVQVGQRLAIIEPGAFRYEGVDELEDAIGAIGEAAQDLVRIDAGMVSPFIEPGFGSGRVLGGRQVEEGEEVAGFEMRAGFLEVGLTLGLDEDRKSTRLHSSH